MTTHKTRPTAHLIQATNHDIRGKMANEVNQQIEDTLNRIVKLTDQSGNMIKEIKKVIHETVSNVRNLTFILKDTTKKKNKRKFSTAKGG